VPFIGINLWKLPSGLLITNQVARSRVLSMRQVTRRDSGAWKLLRSAHVMHGLFDDIPLEKVFYNIDCQLYHILTSRQIHKIMYNINHTKTPYQSDPRNVLGPLQLHFP
jgi:hypothetical protein